MRTDGKGNAGLDFRSMKGHLYTVLLEASGKLSLNRWEGDTVVLAGPINVKIGDWHQFHITARGHTLALECDGQTFNVEHAPRYGRQLTLFFETKGRAEFKELKLRFLPPTAAPR